MLIGNPNQLLICSAAIVVRRVNLQPWSVTIRHRGWHAFVGLSKEQSREPGRIRRPSEVRTAPRSKPNPHRTTPKSEPAEQAHTDEISSKSPYFAVWPQHLQSRPQGKSAARLASVPHKFSDRLSPQYYATALRQKIRPPPCSVFGAC